MSAMATNHEAAETKGTHSHAGHAHEGVKSQTPETPETKVAGIDVTPKAVEAIKKQIAKRNVPETSLRLGIKGGGCSGFSYVIEYCDGPRARDNVFEVEGAKVYVDPKSLIYLNGTTLDWEMTLMNQGFKFINPQEKSNCGCGHSFTV